MKNDNSKVALYIASLGTGGIESCSISQYCHMDKSLVDVEFVVDRPYSPNFNVNKILSNGGTIKCISNTSERGLKRKFLKAINFVRFFKKEQYAVVHFHISHPTTLAYAFLLKLFTKSKIVASSHSQGVNSSKLFQICCRLSSKYLYRFCDVRLADSEEAGRWLFGEHQYDVFLNGVNVDDFKFNAESRKHFRDTYSVDNYDILIGHVGRFVYEKNHSFILEIFRNFLSIEPNSKLCLIGKGELKDTIRKKAEDMGISSKIIYIESVPSVSEAFSAFDLFLFPSIREGFGLVALEAQAASLPVLASDTVPQATTQTTIIKYLSLNTPPGTWAKSIPSLLLNNRESVDIEELTKNCDLKNVSARIVDIYQKLINE